ncbi:MarR family winged helix-turn-helix transcriptional regulator [Methylobacterium fujisawaense]
MGEVELRDQFAGWIALAARQWRRAIDLQLQQYGLTEATWLPLLHLARGAKPLRQKDLAASLFLDSSSVVRVLQNLEASGLIERSESPDDRRAKAIVLTEMGRSTVEQVEVVSAQVRQRTLAKLRNPEIAEATRVLQEVCKALTDISSKETEAP